MRKITSLFIATTFGFLASSANAAVVVANGDFEADADLFVAWPGYVSHTTAAGTNPDAIPSWTHTGGVGINPVVPGGPDDSPFDSPSNTSTGAFALLQGAASLTQIVGGFSVGTDYVLSLDINARDCCGDSPIANVRIDGNILASSTDAFPDPGAIIPAGADDPWYHFDIPFSATAESHELSFDSASAAGGDATFVLDNVSITQVPEPSVAMLGILALGLLGLRRRRG
jgi:MYXO-CTERM domain-containing protein